MMLVVKSWPALPQCHAGMPLPAMGGSMAAPLGSQPGVSPPADTQAIVEKIVKFVMVRPATLSGADCSGTVCERDPLSTKSNQMVLKYQDCRWREARCAVQLVG